ncbi:MAG: hypothetical protein K0R39_2298 [Symbiobacteriaceae bacterium]|jgi:hypothetical protein|nr:hypothetical protein [Symbiobacteriaceae bacterium]
MNKFGSLCAEGENSNKPWAATLGRVQAAEKPPTSTVSGQTEREGT